MLTCERENSLKDSSFFLSIVPERPEVVVVARDLRQIQNGQELVGAHHNLGVCDVVLKGVIWFLNKSQPKL
jgi:hypothetical protein